MDYMKEIMELKSQMKQNPKKKKEIQKQIQTIQEEMENLKLKEKEEVKVEVDTFKKKKKRRDKMAEFELEREKALIEQEQMIDYKQIEKEQLDLILKNNNLQIKQILPDGNCLFNSIIHQFHQNNIQLDLDCKKLRQKVAEHIKLNKQNFFPFLSLNDDQFDSYVHNIANTALWGGQIEIQAISNLYNVCIKVFQANTKPIEFNSNLKSIVLNISYHKHEYGLGEHYNSLIPQ